MIALRKDAYQVETKLALLMDSLTFKVGDVIIPIGTSVNAVTNGTSETVGDKYVLGVIVGFCKQNGEVIGSGLDPTNTPNYITTGATNVSTVKYHCRYIPITPDMEWRMTLSAAAGTTAASDDEFAWFSLTDCRTVNEASAVTYPTTSLQIMSFGVDPEDSTSKTIIGRFAKCALTRLA